MFREDYKQILATISITDITGVYGFTPNRGGFIPCPFHSEKTGSLKLFYDTNRFKCFGCGEQGDIVDFVQKYEKLNYTDAVTKISNLFGLDLTPDKPVSREEIKLAQLKRRVAEFDRIAADYIKSEILNRIGAKICAIRNTGDADEIERLEFLHDTISGTQNDSEKYAFIYGSNPIKLIEAIRWGFITV